MAARWWAAMVPGFVMSAMMASWLCWGWPGPWQQSLVPTLLLFFPLWIAVICFALHAQSAARVWLVMVASSVGGLALLWWFQGMGWVR